ncbi:hypothetical protein [Streptomyces sp. JJ38]|uniref:hypothetical protein n=1 Tax=Streptomyces sp. JJ38 TaxID=2738128 RepID=UPI001C59BEB9|nr:hypothetical protein [Streptomyces sp. JJ38]MBW1597600.1 hypothetical protein [Streptomyces sp. JJ38]
MTGDDRPSMPPVRLPAEAELARDALAAPLLHRAVALARWAGDGVRLTVGGELPAQRLAQAREALGLTADRPADEVAGAEGGEGDEPVMDAWRIAVESGLVNIAPQAGDEEDVATAGEAVKLLTAGGPGDVLDVWRDVWGAALALALVPPLDELVGDLLEATPGDGSGEADPTEAAEAEWDVDEAADFLDAALANLYLLTATDPAVTAGAPVPLPVLAASMVLPDDADGLEQPTDAVLEEVSDVMMRLDAQLRGLEAAGAVEYRPVDEDLLLEADEQQVATEELEDEELTRYGMVRFTALGLYGERARLLEAGVEAPLVGDLAGADAVEVLSAVCGYPEESAQAELEQWLDGRPVAEAARALLSAARGTDVLAPRRRLLCQQGLSVVGPEAEPALREVLSDPELGGLARVWLTERGAQDVPPPDEELVFWLTVDTLAAQLDPEDPTVAPPELGELMAGLVAQHSGFFDKAWRVDHPATAHVLEAMARAHPDRATAKAARKAAYKARSHQS